MKRLFPLLILLIIGLLPVVSAQENYVCGVYFTKVGCTHCAKADPYVLQSFLENYPELIVIEYEVSQSNNGPVFSNYNNIYNSGWGVPVIIFDEDNLLVGDTSIIEGIPLFVNSVQENGCPLLEGQLDFSNINLSSLPGSVKIWHQNRILMSTDSCGDDELLKELLVTQDIKEMLEGKSYKIINPQKVSISGGSIEFDNAIEIEGWIFQWDGEPFDLGNSTGQNDSECEGDIDGTTTESELTWTKLLSLAAVDAINPCELAVLTLVLIAILTHDPKNKKNILYAGLAFSLTVYVMYLVYGLILIKFFQVAQALSEVRLLLYQLLGIAAIILGILNLKDFFWYKPGGFMTEMPMGLRPMAGKIIKNITSPKGAVVMGAIVTLFLLPCTIGPYVIASGILSIFDLVQILPYLLVYNFVFILPMLAITSIVYFEIAKAEDVKGWKDKNVKYMHLVSGAIILILGIAMVLGLL